MARRALSLCHWIEHWAPFRFHGTSLAPGELLCAKLMVTFYLFSKGELGGDVFLPFWTGLDSIPIGPALTRSMVWWAFHLFAIMLIFNRVPRLSAFGAGSILIWTIMASRLDYSNSRLFFGLFLVLIGLQDGSARGRVALHAQLVLIYGGAALNKLLDPSWRDGSALDYLCGKILGLNHWQFMTQGVPVAVFSWAVIATETMLAIGFCRSRWVSQSIWLGLAFHVGMLVFTAGYLSWTFLYAMGAAFIAVAPHLKSSGEALPNADCDDQTCWRLLLHSPQFCLGLAGGFWVAKYIS